MILRLKLRFEKTPLNFFSANSTRVDVSDSSTMCRHIISSSNINRHPSQLLHVNTMQDQAMSSFTMTRICLKF